MSPVGADSRSRRAGPDADRTELRRVSPAERRQRVAAETERVRRAASRSGRASGASARPAPTRTAPKAKTPPKTKTKTKAKTTSTRTSAGRPRTAAYAHGSRRATIRISTRPEPELGRRPLRPAVPPAAPRRAVAAPVAAPAARTRREPEVAGEHRSGGAVVLAVFVAVWRLLVSGVTFFFRRTSPPTGPRLLHTEMKTSRSHTRRRLIGMLTLVALLFTVIVVKLANLQVLHPEQYQEFGASQRVHDEVLAADRGTIYDRNGVELAMSLPQKSVFVDPKLITDPTDEAQKLGAAVNIAPATIEAKMRADNRFGYIARFLPDDMAKKVDDLKLPGVAFVDEPKRYTPSADLTQAMVGTVDPEGNGTAGLEKQYTSELAGTPGKLIFEQTPDGRTIPVGEHDLEPAKKGDDLVMSVDRSMQFEVQRALTDQVKAVGAKGGMAIVSKPDTGEVLAMVNVRADDKGDVQPNGDNAPLTGVYEPGSVMKLVTATGAIEDGKVTPDTPFNLPSVLSIADATFTDAEDRGPVTWPVKDIIAQSSNIGTILIGQRLGKERIYDYMQSFGFGQKTAIDFPGEASGVVHPPKTWSDTSLATGVIGQGVSVTPMQMLEAYNVIANGGVYVPPKLVMATVDSNGDRHPTTSGDTRRVVSQATSNELNMILRGVVSQGTGTKGAVPGYTVAGKTGTARKPINGGYTGPDGITHYMSTFVGFAPAEAPAVSVIVVIDDPPGDQIFGGTVAAPVYSKITDFALRQLGTPPPSIDPPAGGGAAHPDQQAKQAALVDGSASKAEDTESVQIDADGRVHGVAAGLPPVVPFPPPGTPTTPIPSAPTSTVPVYTAPTTTRSTATTQTTTKTSTPRKT